MNGSPAKLIAGCCMLALMMGCIVRNGEVRVTEVTRWRNQAIRSPVRAHLVDGHTITFTDGVAISRDGYVRGTGTRWDVTLREVGQVGGVPLDSVVGMETFRVGANVPASIALTIPAVALTGFGALALGKALFGSCPTFYIDDGEEAILQAEGFSYSIAPLLESRDVDRLGVRPDANGMVRIEVRNEALETHYVNHIELLELRHGPEERVVPDYQGHPVTVGRLQAAAVATDRGGRSLLPLLRETDGLVFESAPEILARAGIGDLHDHIDLTFPAPANADSAALVLRLRNSLLTTILLYDVLMRDQGPAALDWLGRDLDQVGTALELGLWYTRQMGLHVQVWSDGAYQDVARVSETGPIAWKELAVMLPVDPGVENLRVRLRFLADNWRIDQAALAMESDRPEPVILPVSGVWLADGTPQPEALRAMADPDEEYLTTTPGQHYFIHFDVTPSDGTERTYLLASQGYYSEWMRRDWLRAESPAAPLRPSDDLLVEALHRWRTRKPDFEEEFYSSRIAVR